MINPVFDNALETIRQAMGTIEEETTRLRLVEIRAQGAQQRLDALRAQERELQQTLNELAPQVAATRQTIAEAEAAAKQAVAEGERRRDQIVAAAHLDGIAIETRAHDAATSIVENAKKEAEPYAEKVAAAKRELQAVKSQMDAIHSQVNKAENTLAAMKRNAAAWGTA